MEIFEKEKKLEPVSSDSAVGSKRIASLKIFENWPAKLGVIFVIIAMVWFMHYAVTNHLFTPTIEFICYCLASTLTLVLGLLLIWKKRFIRGGEILACLGNLALIVTLCYGQYYLKYYGSVTTFLISIFLIASQLFLSFILNSQSLAIYLTATSYLIPRLVGGVFYNPEFSLAYSLVISLMTATLYLRYWVIPSLISVIAMCLLSANYYFYHYSFIYRIACGLVFFLIWNYLAYKNHRLWIINKVKATAIIFCSLMLILVYSSNYEIDFNRYLEIILGILSVLAITIRYVDKAKNMTLINAVVGFYLLVTALTLAFEFTDLEFVTYIYLAIVFAVGYSRFILKNKMTAFWIAHAQIIPVICCLFFYNPLEFNWYESGFEVYTVAIISLCLTIAMNWRRKETQLISILFITTFAFLAIDVWYCCEQLFHNNMGRALALTLFTLFGVICLFFKKKLIRMMGLASIVGVAIRLLLVEIWLMPTLLRIVTFLVIGLLLVSTAFIEKRSKGQKAIN